MLCNTPNRLQLEKVGLSTKKCVLGKGAYGTVVLGPAVQGQEGGRESNGEGGRRQEHEEEEIAGKRASSYAIRP